MEQQLNINLDDSGKITSTETFCIYAGLVFFSKKERDRFITMYKKIVSDVRCSYCDKDASACDRVCPELKSFNLKKKDLRRFLNHIKRYFTVGCIIKNDSLRNHVIADAASKRRFTDYAIKRLIKKIINELIFEGRIDPNSPVQLILNVDQQSTKSSGYYELDEGIKEELLHGIYNFNYNKYHEPILFGGLDIVLNYCKSDQNYAIQAADLVAGTIRRNLSNMGNIDFVKIRIYLP